MLVGRAGGRAGGDDQQSERCLATVPPKTRLPNAPTSWPAPTRRRGGRRMYRRARPDRGGGTSRHPRGQRRAAGGGSVGNVRTYPHSDWACRWRRPGRTTSSPATTSSSADGPAPSATGREISACKTAIACWCSARGSTCGRCRTTGISSPGTRIKSRWTWTPPNWKNPWSARTCPSWLTRGIFSGRWSSRWTARGWPTHGSFQHAAWREWCQDAAGTLSGVPAG